MKKHILFVAHGMGDQKDGWHADVSDALETSYENPIYTRREDPFLDCYEVEPINYFDVFERLRKEWEDAPFSQINSG